MLRIAIILLFTLMLSHWAYLDKKQGFIYGKNLLMSLPFIILFSFYYVWSFPLFMSILIVTRLVSIKIKGFGSADRFAISIIMPALIILSEWIKFNPLALMPFVVFLTLTTCFQYVRGSRGIRYLPHLYWAFLSSVVFQVAFYSIIL